VHVRRLRAKLGSEYESMIGTVRQVGYKFVVPAARGLADRSTTDPDLDVADPDDVNHPANRLLT
jgi:DNA-binding winged helix-turn-helix (wHTH) protein